MKLKNIRELAEESGFKRNLVSVATVRKEAIKWIKSLEKEGVSCFPLSSFIDLKKEEYK